MARHGVASHFLLAPDDAEAHAGQQFAGFRWLMALSLAYHMARSDVGVRAS